MGKMADLDLDRAKNSIISNDVLKMLDTDAD